ncbi:hypothetical protein AVEN_141203-1 [Araneus ventricosus]|uniref:Uncharacterized protein n=1 Tax=Araneus ventricosus TaxID=182803 RepID=A0A4Y2WQ77_ARAVE|nr:hypothetical protein AVEN_141203-1 [Araneus ventricosus]
MTNLWQACCKLKLLSGYPPPDIGNSFCLVVRIFVSEPKGLRFCPAAKVVTRGQRTRYNNLQSHYPESNFSLQQTCTASLQAFCKFVTTSVKQACIANSLQIIAKTEYEHNPG